MQTARYWINDNGFLPGRFSVRCFRHRCGHGIPAADQTELGACEGCERQAALEAEGQEVRGGLQECEVCGTWSSSTIWSAGFTLCNPKSEAQRGRLGSCWGRACERARVREQAERDRRDANTADPGRKSAESCAVILLQRHGRRYVRRAKTYRRHPAVADAVETIMASPELQARHHLDLEVSLVALT